MCANLGLLLKQLPLSNGVVQLGVGVADFLLHHEELEALRQPFLRSVPVRNKRQGEPRGSQMSDLRLRRAAPHHFARGLMI